MIILPAHAKINLALEVTGRAQSGLHTLESVVVRIDWHDLVGVSRAASPPSGSEGAEPTLRVEGSTQGIPTGADNLAVRGAVAVARLTGTEPPNAIWLWKRVPSAAGLGGGSADAAAAMRAAIALNGAAAAHIVKEEWSAVAAAIGSDVPALFAGRAQLVSGTGEVLEPLPTPELHLVVAVAGTSSTRAAYGALTPGELGSRGRAAALADALRGRRPIDGDLFGSGLEAAATRANPGLGESLNRIRATFSSVRWHLTGSGGAVFALTGNAADATTLATALRSAGHVARACRTVAA